ncbi:EAL domain-containing protein [Selenomonas ruminantium]|uniref:Diguanylate cyclase/phosphodiesterase n=1 Tax=Selenomonas ruminantium TaxID=971 RepID=A0A1H0RQI1_SELRU|nr:GGDEF domain-containing phosphodiesterase [Selenomonas ruminantium]SDP31226.1 diguanylate cyclase/phosphodiesterase [Selenomonas ruminantium]
MWNWLSNYNYDFALATIPIQLILMTVYYLRRQLPTRQSRSFWWVMIMNVVMTVTDIWACELNEVWQEYPLSLSYGLNIAYFLSFILRGWLLFVYASEVVNAPRRWGRRYTWGCFVPAAVVCLIILSTPWTGAIFTMDPVTGYHNLAYYNAIYFSTWFYIMASVAVLTVCRKEVALKLQIGLYSSNLILAVGILVRHSFMNTLVTSFFSLMAILIIYLTAQNPDSFRDRMVDVFNKSAFAEMAAELLVNEAQFSCFGIGIKNYPSFKTFYGPNTMYKSLLDIGKWLEKQFSGFQVFYLGNGQMVLLEHDSDYSDVQGMAKKIEERFRYPWSDSGGAQAVLGINMIFVSKNVPKKSVRSVEICLEQAFNEAYRRDMTDVYVVDEALLEQMKRQEKIRLIMGRALRENKLEIHLQPMYSVKDGCINAVEVLARLYDEELGYIPPQEFIPLAENDGDIMELGRQIFAKTCHFISEYDLDALGIDFLTINISPAQCLNYNLGDELERIAVRHRISMEKIRLEVTESATGDMESLLEQMRRLKNCGVSFLLDDFGAGTSNIIRVINLPFAMVKIDMQLVWSYFRSSSNMLLHVMRMFQEEKMAIIVEGVEDKHMAQQMASMGCEYEQGYYFSHPLPPKELITFLENHRDYHWLD